MVLVDFVEVGGGVLEDKDSDEHGGVGAWEVDDAGIVGGAVAGCGVVVKTGGGENVLCTSDKILAGFVASHDANLSDSVAKAVSSSVHDQWTAMSDVRVVDGVVPVSVWVCDIRDCQLHIML